MNGLWKGPAVGLRRGVLVCVPGRPLRNAVAPGRGTPPFHPSGFLPPQERRLCAPSGSCLRRNDDYVRPLAPASAGMTTMCALWVLPPQERRLYARAHDGCSKVSIAGAGGGPAGGHAGPPLRI